MVDENICRRCTIEKATRTLLVPNDLCKECYDELVKIHGTQTINQLRKTK